MRTSVTILSSLVAFAIRGVAALEDGGPVTGKLGNATIVENNPPGVMYKAVLPDSAFDKDAFPDGGNVKGEITAVASSDGIGVKIRVKFSNLPKEGGPFPYHLHVDPVPDDGNCTKTLAHLDPYIRGEDIACNGNLSQTCQVGDLSGKHGKIDSDPFEASYTEWYASTVDGIGAFFGNRSFVVHFGNKTRITCANFRKVEGYYEGGDHGGGHGQPGGKPDATASRNLTVQTTASPGPTSSPSFSGVKPSQTFVSVNGASAMRAINLASGALAFAAAITFAL